MSGGSIASSTISELSSIGGSPGVRASAMPARTSRIGNGSPTRSAIHATAATTASNAATVYRASGTGHGSRANGRGDLSAKARRYRLTDAQDVGRGDGKNMHH